MKKPLRTPSNFHTGCVVLCWVVALFVGVHGASARETYQQLMSRLLTPSKDVMVRADLEQAVLLASNGKRVQKKRKPLKLLEGVLRDAARAQAMDLLRMGQMGHLSSGGHDFQSRMSALFPGQMFLPSMAENAARDRRSGVDDAGKALGVVEQWMKSRGHRESLMSQSYESVAIGVVMKGDVLYAVEIFLGPATNNNLFGKPQ